MQVFSEGVRQAIRSYAALKAVSPSLARMVVEERKYALALWGGHRRALSRLLDEVAAPAAAAPSADALEPVLERGRGVYTRVLTSVYEAEGRERMLEIVRVGYEAMVARLKGKGGPLQYEMPESGTLLKAKTEAEASADVAFPLLLSGEDQKSLDAFLRQQVFWIGEVYPALVAPIIREVVADVVFRQGSRERVAVAEIRRRVQEALGAVGEGERLVIPAGYRGTPARYFEGVAANATTLGRVGGAMFALREADATRYEWVTVGDELVCERCATLDGKIFEVKDGIALFERMAGAKNPDEIREIAPWYTARELREMVDGKGHISDAESARLVEAGLGFPPAHFLCRCTIDIAE